MQDFFQNLCSFGPKFFSFEKDAETLIGTNKNCRVFFILPNVALIGA